MQKSTCLMYIGQVLFCLSAEYVYMGQKSPHTEADFRIMDQTR